jgi:hypothetical protein
MTVIYSFPSINLYFFCADRATSEYLPAGQEDLTLSLDVCDYIRGKQVNPRDAIRALKRRISHRNPNVQMLGLKVAKQYMIVVS